MRAATLGLLVAAMPGMARAGDPPPCDAPATIGAALVAAWKAELAARRVPDARPKAESKSFAELVESRERSSKKAPPPAEDDATCKK